VTRLAINGRVRADQRESIFMAAHGLNRNIPAFDRVAGVAVGTELPAVNVCVAVRALLANIREN